MKVILNEINQVIGYSPDTGMDISDEEYMRQIKTNLQYTWDGAEFTSAPFPVPAETEEERQERIRWEEQAQKTSAADHLLMIQAETLAKTMPPSGIQKIKALFPKWQNLVGKQLTKEEFPYIQHGTKVYLVVQNHLVQAQFPPGPGTEALYSEVAPPGTIAPWVQPLGGHDAYNMPGSGLTKSDPVTHKGRTWVSTINANIWEPGVYGWVEQTAPASNRQIK